MKRRSVITALELEASLGPEERQLITVLDRLKLMTHRQLAVLLDDGRDVSPVSAARIARRRLQRLVDLGLLARLERRIGGIRAGSQGFIYYLGPVGQQLIGYWQGQGLVRGRYRPEPGERYVRHRLSVSQVYVDLLHAERAGQLDLMAFDAEPDCWRTFPSDLGGQTLLKPDAFTRVGLGAYEDRYFCELDLGSESRSVIAKKLRTYLSYYNSGQEQHEHGVFPRVLWLVPDERRKTALVEVCQRLPAETWRLFTISLLDQAISVLLNGDSTGAEDAALEASS